MITMDNQRIGMLIARLRKEKEMTQKQIAQRMQISDKTISKWERGEGLPDISLLSELADVLSVSVDVLLAGKIEKRESVGGRMDKTKFYVCPSCGNMIMASNEAGISCCDQKIQALTAQEADENHALRVEILDGEKYVTANHEMTKQHYISFIAQASKEKVEMIKLYPEWNVDLRFPMRGKQKVYFFCTEHGLFTQTI